MTGCDTLNSDTLVRMRASRFCNVRTRLHVSTSLLRQLTETHRRIADSKERIRRTDRLLSVMWEKMSWNPSIELQHPHPSDDLLTVLHELRIAFLGPE